MPPGLLCLYNVDRGSEKESGRLVDIIAVHGIAEDSYDAWKDPKTGINWLRDLLPKNVQVARVLSYGYDATTSSFFGPGSALTLQRLSESFIQEIYADRRQGDMLKHPIIFICHGLGGLLVKKALVYSATRTARSVFHLLDPCVSTYGILFFGTPHRSTSESKWRELERLLTSSNEHSCTSERLYNSLSHGAQICEVVSRESNPIIEKLRLYCFWEKLPSALKGRTDVIVDYSSAVLDIDTTEKSGINATHSNMIKFNSIESTDYRTVIEVIQRFCDESPKYIKNRWNTTVPNLNKLRINEANGDDTLMFDLSSGKPILHSSTDRSIKHFLPPSFADHDFVGRTDKLKVLYDAFFPLGSPVTPQSKNLFIIYGMGGCGKTQLCSKFAQDYKEYYAAVFTIRAATRATISDSLCKIGMLGGLEGTENAGKHFLSQFDKPWLLIIDNADDPDINLLDLLPVRNTAHVLVTTRNPDLREYGYLGSLELKGLNEEDALELLLRKAGITGPWDTSTRNIGISIVKALGYLAIALIQAGRCIFRKICNLGDYLNLHQASRMAANKKRKEVVASVYSTFDLSLDLHTRQQNLPGRDASDLLKIVAFYHFERIPVEIFIRAVLNRKQLRDTSSQPSPLSRIWSEILRRLGTTASLPSFLERFPLDQYDVKEAMSELRTRSLISYDEKDECFSLHPLVHAWIRDSLTEPERIIWCAIAFNTLMESILLPSAGTSPDVDFHKNILPHLDTCLSEHGHPLPPFNQSPNTINALRFFQPLSILAFQYRVSQAAKCGYVFGERGQFHMATSHLEAVKDALMQVRGIGHDQTMMATLGLAGVYWGLGRLDEAIKLQMLVRDSRMKKFGPNHEQTLQVMDQLAMSYWFNGYYQEALDQIQITTDRMKDVLGNTHRTTLTGLDHLGIIYGAWQRHEESLNIHKEVLEIRQRKEDADENLETIEVKHNYAVALLGLGRLAEAKDLMTKVHEQRQRLLGKEHPWTLWSYLYLARINVDMKCYKEAEDMITRGLQAGERSLEKEHIGVLTGLGELARVYARTGRFEESEAITLDVVKGIGKARGLAHPDSVYALFKLAQLYDVKGDPEKAKKTCELALERVDQRLTRKHPMSKQIEDLLRKSEELTEESQAHVVAEIEISQEEATDPKFKFKRAETR